MFYSVFVGCVVVTIFSMLFSKSNACVSLRVRMFCLPSHRCLTSIPARVSLCPGLTCGKIARCVNLSPIGSGWLRLMLNAFNPCPATIAPAETPM